MNDNRKYKFTPESVARRDEYPIIANLIKKGSKVIDLGCGDGSLLKLLKETKETKGLGIEISKSGVVSSLAKKIKAVQGRIDVKLPYRDKEFDYAICNVTLQMVMYPEVLLSEMHRISRYQIVTFPNFAFILNRYELLIKGQMPRTMIPGYDWYSTGHIHQLSIKDYRRFCKTNKFTITREAHIFPSRLFGSTRIVLKSMPNLFASTGIFLTS